jgi:hypothetical protein
MSLSSPFIKRPVATTLLNLSVVLAGAVAFRLLPVSPLPQLDFPVIFIAANLPGASPDDGLDRGDAARARARHHRPGQRAVLQQLAGRRAST